jgi:ribosome recycling factor
MAELSQILKDAAYVGVGLSVLTFQRTQVRRQELLKQLDAQLGDAREGVTKLSETVEDRVKVLEERLEDVQDQVEHVLDQVEGNVERLLDEIAGRLPEQAADAFANARAAARDVTAQLRFRVA